MESENSTLDGAIRRTQASGGVVGYGYSGSECEKLRDYVSRFWSGQGVYVFTEHDPRREYLSCSVVVETRPKK